MYQALELAKYVVNYCYEKYKPVSNLKLQKMLYFLWVDYYKEKGEYLFEENIYAWQFGPVIKEVYYEFSPYAGIPICESFDVDLKDKDDELIIDQIIEKYIDEPVNKLVDKTHKPDGPWYEIYVKKSKQKGIIPFGLIKKLEVDNHA